MSPLVVTPNEASKLMKISVNELNNMLQNGEIPAYKDGRNWKIPLSLLQEYVINKALKEAEERRAGHGN